MSTSIHHNLSGRARRAVRVRKRIFGTLARPRLSVFRSAKHIYAQVIDDEAGTTLASASSHTASVSQSQAEPVGGKRGMASAVGQQLASHCLGKSITEVVFDRNGYRYHGRVQAVAEAAREAGLKF